MSDDRLIEELAARFARNLDRAMKASPLSAHKLAVRADVNYTYLSSIRNGHRTPSVALAALIARALGVSLDSLAYDGERAPAVAPTPAAAQADPLAELYRPGKEPPAERQDPRRRRASD